jgi:uncharacterized protein (TIGR02246 family)
MKQPWLAIGSLLALSTGVVAQVAGDKASVEAFYREWMGAAAQKGPAAYASYYAPEGQLLPPNEPPVVGRAAIEAWLQRAQREATYTTKPEGIAVDEIRFLDGGWAIYRSTLKGQRIPKAGGAPQPFETKYFDVLQRSPEGRWQVAYRMWSDNVAGR